MSKQKQEQMQICVSEKGIALACAVDSGLLPNKTEQGRDITAFENFWNVFIQKRAAILGIDIK